MLVESINDAMLDSIKILNTKKRDIYISQNHISLDECEDIHPSVVIKVLSPNAENEYLNFFKDKDVIGYDVVLENGRVVRVLFRALCHTLSPYPVYAENNSGSNVRYSMKADENSLIQTIGNPKNNELNELEMTLSDNGAHIVISTSNKQKNLDLEINLDTNLTLQSGSVSISTSKTSSYARCSDIGFKTDNPNIVNVIREAGAYTIATDESKRVIDAFLNGVQLSIEEGSKVFKPEYFDFSVLRTISMKMTEGMEKYLEDMPSAILKERLTSAISKVKNLEDKDTCKVIKLTNMDSKRD